MHDFWLSLPTAPRWATALEAEMVAPYMTELGAFLASELAGGRKVYPAPDRFFAALAATPLDQVKVVILGQEPYHGPGQANGMAFAVPPGVRKPPSLRNILKELAADLGIEEPPHGTLDAWARQGVLLLNSVLSVRGGEPASHANRGWERFTDSVIRLVASGERRVAFVLWGAYAQQKASFVDASRHFVHASAHPSPFAAYRGFFGSRPFSAVNNFLRATGSGEIDWRLA